MACGPTDPLGCVSDLAGGAAKKIAGDAFSAIARDFAQAADSAVNWLWGQMSAATSVTLGGTGWETDLTITTALAVSIGLGLFVIQVTASTLRREPGGLARACRGLVVAFIAGGAAIAVTNLLLAVSDALSAGIVQVGTGTTIQGMGRQLLGATTLATVTNPALEILVALAMIAATAIVWFALMTRKLLIIVAAVFAPVAFTGALSDITSSWVRRWIETMIALIASKIILVTIFVVGLGALENGVGETSPTGIGHAGQTTTQIVVGVLILLMAGFSPWLAIKLVHFAGESFHAVHASAGSVSQGAQTAIAAPQKIASMGQRASNTLSSVKSAPAGTSSGSLNGSGSTATPPATAGQNGSMSGAVSANGSGAAGSGAAGAGVGAAGVAGGAVVAGQVGKGLVDAANSKVAEAAGLAVPPGSVPSTSGPSKSPTDPATAGSSTNGSARPPSQPRRSG
jgi:type IV secretion system protein TrbL